MVLALHTECIYLAPCSVELPCNLFDPALLRRQANRQCLRLGLAPNQLLDGQSQLSYLCRQRGERAVRGQWNRVACR